MTPSPLEESLRRVRSSAGLLSLTVATGRRELAACGSVRADLWAIAEAQAVELLAELEVLERAERQAVAR